MKVSVCCITYNHEKFIATAIDSFIIQKLDCDYEIVISDDASSDATVAILKEYEKKYPALIRLILHENNIGMMPNLIQTLLSCKGEYIAVCEGDDYWTDPLKLQKQIDVLEKHSNLSMAAHGSYQLTDSLSIIDSPFQEDIIWSTRDILANNWFIMTASLMIRRSMMDISPKWYSEISHGDLGLILMTSLNGDGFYSPEPMSVYRIAGMGVMSRFTIKDSENYIFLLNQFNRKSGYRFDKEITTLKDKIRIDIVHRYIGQNKSIALFSLRYWQNVIQCLKWARIRNWPNLAKKLVKGKLSK